jgi:hypothetical protein
VRLVVIGCWDGAEQYGRRENAGTVEDAGCGLVARFAEVEFFDDERHPVQVRLQPRAQRAATSLAAAAEHEAFSDQRDRVGVEVGA